MITVNGKKINASPNENLLRVLQREGFFLPSDCNGKGTCGKCVAQVDGVIQNACRVFLSGGENVVLPEHKNIVSEIGAPEREKKGTENIVAVDIGTTTVAVCLCDKDGSPVAAKTFDNPQRLFGSDVVSRLDAVKKNGVDALRTPLVSALEKSIFSLTNGTAPKKIFICGNTVMLHIFCGKDCSSLGVFPYTPDFLNGQKGTLCGAGYETLPCLAPYVGADVTADVMYIEATERKVGYRLLIDLGTNAEIVLFGDGKYYATATAAGPCFEGGNISCGMPACEGAVYRFCLDENESAKEKHFGLKARGLCGSGLIDVVGQLVRHGIIDEKGTFTTGNGYLIAPSVLLTQGDVRNYQLAKSAVASGIEVLMKKANVLPEDVGTVYLAGGFSAAISPENAVFSGLIPSWAQNKCVPINNSALKGTALCSANKVSPDDFIANGRFVDLTCDADFSELFIDNLSFR